MTVYIVFEVYRSTGRLLRIVDTFDNIEAANECVNNWKKIVKKDEPYEFQIFEEEVKSNV